MVSQNHESILYLFLDGNYGWNIHWTRRNLFGLSRRCLNSLRNKSLLVIGHQYCPTVLVLSRLLLHSQVRPHNQFPFFSFDQGEYHKEVNFSVLWRYWSWISLNYCSKFQLALAKVLTVAYTMLMVAVYVGLAVQIVDKGWLSSTAFTTYSFFGPLIIAGTFLIVKQGPISWWHLF